MSLFTSTETIRDTSPGNRRRWDRALTRGVLCIAIGLLATLPTARADIFGFGVESNWTFNGDANADAAGVPALIDPNTLRITSADDFEAASVFFNQKQDVTNFTTEFDYQVVGGTDPPADGFAFVMQNTGLDALGGAGGDKGYGGIGASVAVQFDHWLGSEVELGVNGAVVSEVSTLPRVDFRNGNLIHTTLNYNGTVLIIDLEDVTTGQTFSTSYSVDILAAVGDPTAYIGFTGGTGGANADQRISGFSFTSGTATPQDPIGTFDGSLDIGNPGLPGNAAYDVLTDTYTVTGSGGDVWGTSDQFHFAYTGLSGNATLIARVLDVDSPHAWSKAGVMARETLGADSSYSFALVNGNGDFAPQWRSGTGLNAQGDPVSNRGDLPVWIRLMRDGDTFYTSTSLDGLNWTSLGSPWDIPMAPDIYIGLAVTSHNNDETATAVFDNVHDSDQAQRTWTGGGGDYNDGANYDDPGGGSPNNWTIVDIPSGGAPTVPEGATGEAFSLNLGSGGVFFLGAGSTFRTFNLDAPEATINADDNATLSFERGQLDRFVNDSGYASVEVGFNKNDAWNTPRRWQVHASIGTVEFADNGEFNKNGSGPLGVGEFIGTGLTVNVDGGPLFVGSHTLDSVININMADGTSLAVIPEWTFQEAPTADGLIVHYNFDGLGTAESTTVPDASGSPTDHFGSADGYTEHTDDGVIGGAQIFFGNGDGIDVSGDPFAEAGVDGATISAWLNPDYPGAAFQLFTADTAAGPGSIQFGASGNTYYWQLTDDDGNVERAFADPPNDGGGNNAAGWQHFTWVLGSDGVYRMHVDGRRVGEADMGSLADIPRTVTLLDGFSGSVDDVRMYDRALTEAEINALAGNRDRVGDFPIVSVTGTADFGAAGDQPSEIPILNMANGATFFAHSETNVGTMNVDPSATSIGLSADNPGDLGINILDLGGSSPKISLDGIDVGKILNLLNSGADTQWEIAGQVDADPADLLGFLVTIVDGGMLELNVDPEGSPTDVLDMSLWGGCLQITVESDLVWEPGLIQWEIPGDATGDFNDHCDCEFSCEPNPEFSVGFPDIPENTTFRYKGQIYDADGHFSFAENIDDKVLMMIDGKTVVSDDVWNVETYSPDLGLADNPDLGPGWHEIAIEVVNLTGPGGTAAGAPFGIGIDSAGGTSFVPLEDSGDGSLLRHQIRPGVDLPDLIVAVPADSHMFLNSNDEVRIGTGNFDAILIVSGLPGAGFAINNATYAGHDGGINAEVDTVIDELSSLNGEAGTFTVGGTKSVTIAGTPALDSNQTIINLNPDLRINVAESGLATGDASITLNGDGRLTVQWKGATNGDVINVIPVPIIATDNNTLTSAYPDNAVGTVTTHYTGEIAVSSLGVLALGSRTGGASETHWFDNVRIDVDGTVTTTGNTIVGNVMGEGTLVVEKTANTMIGQSADLGEIIVRQGATLDAAGMPGGSFFLRDFTGETGAAFNGNMRTDRAVFADDFSLDGSIEVPRISEEPGLAGALGVGFDTWETVPSLNAVQPTMKIVGNGPIADGVEVHVAGKWTFYVPDVAPCCEPYLRLSASGLGPGPVFDVPSTGSLDAWWLPAGPDGAANLTAIDGVEAFDFQGGVAFRAPAFDLTGNFSHAVESWVYYDGVSLSGALAAFGFLGGPVAGSADTFRLNNDGTFTVAVWGGQTTAPMPLIEGAWNHLVKSYDADSHTFRIYVNGVPVADYTPGGPLNIASGGAWVAGELGWAGLGNLFTGPVANVNIYDKELTDAQAQQNFEAGPLATVDDGVGTVLDLTPHHIVFNENDTTITFADGIVGVNFGSLKAPDTVSQVNLTFENPDPDNPPKVYVRSYFDVCPYDSTWDVSGNVGPLPLMALSLGGPTSIGCSEAEKGKSKAAGSLGTLHLIGNLTLEATSTFHADVQGTGSDLIDVSDTLQLDPGATLALEINGAAPFKKGTVTLLQAGQLSGSFDNLIGLGEYVTIGKADGLTYSGTGLTLTIQKDLHMGDANLDTVTDGSDFNIWNANRFTYDTEWRTSDFNNDGLTDGSDFNIWNENKFTAADKDGGAPSPTDGPKGGLADFLYDPATGILSVDTDGEKLVSMLVEGPRAEAVNRTLGGDPGADPAEGTLFMQKYFNGKEQWIDGSIQGVRGQFELAAYLTGLGEDDFGSVEYSTLKGTTFFGSVQIVPEPTTPILLAGGLLGLIWWRRRRTGPRQT